MVTRMTYKIILPILGLILLTEGSKFIKFKKLTCNPNPDVFENTTCFLKPVSWTKTRATIEADLKIDIYKFYVNGALYKQYGLSYQPFLVNYTQDSCKMLDGQRSSLIYANIIMYLTKKIDTNILQPCPWKAGHIYGRNMEISQYDLKYFDRFLLLGNFMVNIIIVGTNKNGQNISVGNGAIYGSIVEETIRGGKKVHRTEHQ